MNVSSVFSFFLFFFFSSVFSFRTFTLISHLIPLWSENMFCMVLVFLNVLKCILCPNIWSFLENVPYAPDKKVYSAAVGCSVLYMSLSSSWLIMLFKSSVSLLISVLFHPSLKVGYICVLLLLFGVLIVSFRFIYFVAWFMGLYLICLLDGLVFLSLCNSLLSFTVIFLKLYLSDINIDNPAVFWLVFAWNIFFHISKFST